MLTPPRLVATGLFEEAAEGEEEAEAEPKEVEGEGGERGEGENALAPAQLSEGTAAPEGEDGEENEGVGGENPEGDATALAAVAAACTMPALAFCSISLSA